MDVTAQDVCEIAGFRVTEFKIIWYGKVIDVFFNIRDKDGRIMSRNFDDQKEPENVLRRIEESISNESF